VIAVREWGLRDYASALEEMRSLREERQRGKIPDTLLLMEHPPVITIGVQGDDGETLPPGLPVFRVERGGKSTYHGPGQLVGYPIVDLTPRGRDVRRFVSEIEELLIAALAEFQLAAHRIPQKRGVWVAGDRKIASIGVAVENWIAFHGFALNVSTDLGAFAPFHPCGYSPALMTSMERELGRRIGLEVVAPGVVRAWNRIFGSGFQAAEKESRSFNPAAPAPATR
jgi:lipoate-protein ligase B